MSTFDGLLDAIRDDPGDDTPRLVLADWFDDHDEPRRAELIRVQCLLARLPAGHDLRPELEARERGLLLLHERGWADLPEAAAGTFRRGFLDRLAVPARLLLREPERLMGQGTVTELELKFEDYAELERVADLPVLRSVRRLTLRGQHLHQGGLNALLDSPFLARLEGVALRCRTVSRRGLRRLRQGLATLRELEIAGADGFAVSDLVALLPDEPSALERFAVIDTRTGAEIGNRLGACPHLGRLRDLTLRNVNLDDDGLAALGRADFAAGVERLTLSWNETFDRSPEVVLHDDLGFRNLRVLDTTGCTFDWDAEPERPCSFEPHLRELSLSVRRHPFGAGLARWLRQGCTVGLVALNVTPEDDLRWDTAAALLDTLAHSPTLARLRKLRLGSWLHHDQLAGLLSGPNARCWRHLELTYSNLQGGLGPLLDGDELHLRRLALTRCWLNDLDAEALADCPWLSDLRELDLSGNDLGDRAVDCLVRSPYLRRLTSLDLSRNRITDGGRLVGSYLANPAILNLADNRLREGADDLLRAGVEAMRAALAVPVLADLSDAAP